MGGVGNRGIRWAGHFTGRYRILANQIYVTAKRSGNIFVTSDPHYDHDDIRIHCGRPFSSVDEMNESLIENHNKLVAPRDTVIIVGDLAFSRHMHFIHALNGRKILVIGNHDRMSRLALEQFTKVVGTPKHPGIYQRVIDGQDCVFSHFPLWSWNGSFHGSWHFYGHCHGRKPEFDPPDLNDETKGELPPPRIVEFVDGLSCAVDVDVWGFAPVPWEVLKAKLLERTEAWKQRKARWQASMANYKAVDAKRKDYPEQLAAANKLWRERVVIRKPT